MVSWGRARSTQGHVEPRTGLAGRLLAGQPGKQSWHGLSSTTGTHCIRAGAADRKISSADLHLQLLKDAWLALPVSIWANQRYWVKHRWGDVVQMMNPFPEPRGLSWNSRADVCPAGVSSQTRTDGG